MKSLIINIGVFFSLLILVNACEKETTPYEYTGSVRFALTSNVTDGSLKNVIPDTIPAPAASLVVSITDKYGNSVYNKKNLILYRFGSEYISEEIELSEGQYFLTEFYVVNPDGAVVFATPLEGSSLAYLVMDPLPVSFYITAGDILTVNPEVLATTDMLPDDFGYASFTLTIIKPVHLFIAVVNDNPLSLSPSYYIPADVKITGYNNWSHFYNLSAGINEIIIRGGCGQYHFIVYREGTSLGDFWFSESDIVGTSYEAPLILSVNPFSNILEIQPGPDEGKDAVIFDLQPDSNFGSYPYFQAGFASEPVLTVMRTSRSLINFNLNQYLPKSAIIQKVFITLTLIYDNYIDIDLSILPDSDKYIAVFRQIVEPWDEYSVTWNNQPKTITANEVYINYHPELSTIFRRYDVTTLFVPYAEIAASNYGMMMMSLDNNIVFATPFASSDYHIDVYRPKLTVYYTLYGLTD